MISVLQGMLGQMLRRLLQCGNPQKSHQEEDKDMEEKTIAERAAELLDRFGEIHDAYIRSVYHALDLADEAYRDDKSERDMSYRELQAEADAVTAGFDRALDAYVDDVEGFWQKYGAADAMEDIDVLIKILLTEGEPDVR